MAVNKQKGAALILVLGIVAVMSAGLLVSLDNLTAGARREAAYRAHAQARAYALAGEIGALAQGEDFVKTRGAVPRKLTQPLDNGRVVSLLRDGSNCFNLAALVRVKHKKTLADAAAGAAFTRLLLALELDAIPPRLGDAAAQNLTAALTAWQGGKVLTSFDELRLIAGFTRPVRAALRPLACIGGRGAARLNVNALTPTHLPLLAAMLGAGYSRAQLAALLAARPPEGYRHIQAFWSRALFREIPPDKAVRARFTIAPTRLVVAVDVAYAGTRARLISHFLVKGAARFDMMSRRFGA